MARRLGTAYVGIEADATLFRASAMAGMKKALAGLEADIPVNANMRKANAAVQRFLAEIQVLNPTMNVDMDAHAAEAVLTDLRHRIGDVADLLDELRANPNLAQDGLRQVARLQIAAREAAAQLNKMKPNPKNFQDMEHAVLSLESGFNRVTAGVEKFEQAERQAATRAAFLRQLSPQLTALANRLSTMKAGIDDSEFNAKIAGMESRLAEFPGRKFDVSKTGFTKMRSELARMEADTDKLTEAMVRFAQAERDAEVWQRFFRSLRPEIEALAERLAAMKVGIDDQQFSADVQRLEARLRQFADTKFDISQAGFARARSDMAALTAGADKLTARMDKVTTSTRDAAEQARFLAGLRPRFDSLARTLAGLKVGMNDQDVLAKIARIEAALARLRARKIQISEEGFAKARSELAALEAGTNALSSAIEHNNDRLTKGKVAWFGWIGGLLNAKVALYAGARVTSGWHIALDSVIETLAILVPALTVMTAGLGAFGAAAYLAQDTLTRIGKHMQYVKTVSDATGKVIPPLTDHFNKMAQVIRPQVFELLGAALGGAHRQLGLFDKLATSTGGLLDRMAARIIVDMESGSGGIKKFVESGQEDLKYLGVIFVNLGHVIAQIGRVASQTHIAEHLVQGLAGLSQMFKLISDLPTPLLVAIALIHGWYLWIGIATSAAVKLFLGPLRGLANLAAGADKAGDAVKKLDKDATAGKRLKAYVSDIGTGFSQLPGRVGEFASKLKGLFLNPWTWAVVGAVALGVLATVILRSKSASEQFNDSMQRLVRNSSIFNVINATGAALIQTNRKLSESVSALHGSQAKAASSSVKWAGSLRGIGPLMNTQRQSVDQLTSGHKQLEDQLKLETSRISEISQRFGTKGLTGAMALAALAGVRVSDMLSKNMLVWATAIVQIQNLVNGYKAMGQGAGQLASDLNALTVAGSEQVKQIDSLNQAFDFFTKTVSGPISGFLSFTQTIQRFGQDAKQTGAHMSGLGGVIENTSKKVRSSSVQLQLDFQDTFNSAEQLFDAMRSSQAPADVQVSAIKHAVQALIPMAGANKAAAAEVSALAQEAGGPATTNLQTLQKWAGKTHDPLKALNDDASRAAVGFSNLSLDAQKLGTALSQDLTAEMAKAVENAVGLQGAMNKYAEDVRKGTQATADGQKDRAALNEILTLITGSGKDAAAVIQAMTDKIRGHGNAIKDTSKARTTYYNDIVNILSQAPKASGDVQHLADMIKVHGIKSDEAQKARKKLIDDLKSSGVQADEAKRLVDKLATSVKNLPAGKTMKIKMTADGFVNITEGKQKFSISQGAWFSPHATGGFISMGSGPRSDDVPALLSRGEYVHQASSVSRYGLEAMDAVNQGRAVIGYAKGGPIGAVGNLKGTPDTWPPQMYSVLQAQSQAQMVRAVSIGLEAAVKAGMKLALAAGSGTAVLAYAETFRNRAPYVWGGNTPAGWDCSGFVEYVLNHFGIGMAGRPTAASFQSWARPSAPVPGGLAFYGTPAHHVGFVVNASTLLSALGSRFGTIESGLNMGDNSGYGVPPKGYGNVKGIAGGGDIAGNKLKELAFSLLTQYQWGNQWPAFNMLETREANWNMHAVNPGSGAAGLAQFIRGWSEYFDYGGNPSTAMGQLTAMMNYIAQMYPSGPNAAWAHEVAHNWYAHGGPVGVYDRGGFLPTGASIAVNNTGRPEQVIPGMASGGEVPVAKYVPQLKAAQAGEVRDYKGLVAAYKHDLATAKKGSWTADHRAGITSELGTLSRRQATESAAYNAILARGTSKTNLTHLGSGVKGVVTVSHDIDLRHSHPGWSHGLWYWLGKLSNLSKDSVAPTWGGAATKLQFGPWLAKLKAAEKDQEHDMFWLNAVFYRLLKNAKPGSWLYKNRTAVRERLYGIAVKDNAEDKAYKDLLAHSTGSIGNLDTMAARIGKINATARAEAAALQPSLIGHAGGSPYWTRQVQQSLGTLVKLTGTLPFFPAWVPGNLGASHAVHGGVLKFDRGGWLPTGLSLSYNGTGRPEPVGVPNITIEIAGSGNTGFDAFMMQWIQGAVRVKGGGNVQTAFGRR